MDRCVSAAALLAESDRKDLAIEALARSATISDLSARHGVSREFIYRQADKARTALDDAFLSTASVKVFGCRQVYENRPCRNPRDCGDGLWGFWGDFGFCRSAM